MPAVFLPLKELENLAPDTWYVNVLAVRPQFRGAGLGTRLLAHPTTLQANAAIGASALLFPMPGVRADTPAMVKEAWVNEGQNWVLLMKTLG